MDAGAVLAALHAGLFVVLSLALSEFVPAGANEMTQAELAAKIGVTRQTLLAIEAAKYSPSPELAFRIARVFGVPLDAVFQYEA